MSQNAYLSTPDPEWVAALGGKPLPSRVPEGTGDAPLDWAALRAGMRAALEGAFASAPNQVPISELKTTTLTIPTSDGSPLPAEAYIPEPKAELGEQSGHRFPLVYWLHGGGWCLGDHIADRLTFQKVAVECRVSVISVGYRLAPEFPFPTGVNDAYDGLKWSADHEKELRADISKGFIVGGMSAGGNLAAVVAHLARDDPDFRHKITGQLLQIPSLINPAGVPDHLKDELLSHTQNVDDQILTPKLVDHFIKSYKGDPLDTRFSPILLSSFKDLPPAYMQVGGADLLRDEAYVYQRYLQEAGIPAKLDVYPGVPHGWFIFHPELKISVKFHQDTHVGLKWLLNGAR